MAGHSKFKNIMHRKGAQDKKRGKVFTKLIRELTVAAKEGGGDPDANPRLRSAITAARAANMPNDNVDRAIKRAVGGDDDTNYEEIRYEGYGPAGVAVIVETLTDNRNRTASEVRSTFTKYGGNLGESNSVSFQFTRQGLIEYPLNSGSKEAIFDAALEAGAEDVETQEDLHVIKCAADDLNVVRQALSETLGEPATAKLSWEPQNTISLEEEPAKTLLKLIDTLEDNDDVQNVFANFEIEDDLLKKLDL
tara:strand:- start:4 stop:753 length:750 start_codon:yes stop_codon:yes gene_type:complete